VQSVLLSFDYRDKNILLEFKGKGTDEAKLKQVADMLNGLKAFGGMLAAEKPEFGELMSKIEVTSGKDHVTIAAVLPEDLIKKLAAAAEDILPKTDPETAEEPTEEDLSEEDQYEQPGSF